MRKRHRIEYMIGLQESELFGVQNKSQYLMSLMRNFRDRIRQQGAASVSSKGGGGEAQSQIHEHIDHLLTFMRSLYSWI